MSYHPVVVGEDQRRLWEARLLGMYGANHSTFTQVDPVTHAFVPRENSSVYYPALYLTPAKPQFYGFDPGSDPVCFVWMASSSILLCLMHAASREQLHFPLSCSLSQCLHAGPAVPKLAGGGNVPPCGSAS